MDKDSGQVIWQFQTSHYMWSSPVALYTPEGKSYIFQADSRGICYLLDGATGELLDRIDIDSTVEASPVAFGNRVVLGTRSRIYLFEIT
jgi:outer membrane protein assembly factor BamB